jgi:hypothetical protein
MHSGIIPRLCVTELTGNVAELAFVIFTLDPSQVCGAPTVRTSLWSRTNQPMNASDTYCAGPLAGLSSLLLDSLPQANSQEMLGLDCDFDFKLEPWEDEPFETCDFSEGRTLPDCE